MATYGSPQTEQVRALIAEVKTLVNQKLKDILRAEQLAVSGLKSELQIRIIARIERMANTGDAAGLNRIRDLIAGGSHSSSNFLPYSSFTPPSSASPQYSSPAPRPPPYNMPPSTQYGSRPLNFRPSPFYKILRPLTSVVDCKAREHTRDTARLEIRLDQQTADQLQKDSNTRVMVFCAAESFGVPQQDIAFPHQVELKCNSDDIKANLRGLKNKPGSTRPADITQQIRKKPNYLNSVEMVYALTQKELLLAQKYHIVVNLVQRHTLDDLVTNRKAFVLSKEQVLREMNRRKDDPDIEATSSALSLKCPLSATRISNPFRSSNCPHNQCFDAASYLQLQEQAPTWTCPVCNRAAPFETLVMDLYVDSILKSTSPDTEQVIIEPDGQWRLQGPSSTLANTNKDQTPDSETSEGFIEIQDDRISSLKTEHRFLNSPTIRTPPTSSREQSIASSSAQRSNKRPVSEVIDLTLSDDDDDGPRPPKIKRPSMSSSNGNATPYSAGSTNSSSNWDRGNYAFTFPRPNLPPPPAPFGK